MSICFYAMNVILIETTHMMYINTEHKLVPSPGPVHYSIFPVPISLDLTNQLINNPSCAEVSGLE